MNHLGTVSAQTQLIEFLKQELALPSRSIAIAQRSVPQNPNLLPLALWQYGLVTLEELDRIYDWLETIHI